MKRLFVPLEVLQFVAVVAAATGSVYITDLPDFASLAPCAASGLSYVVQQLTASKCPPAVSELVSCACTKDSNSGALLASISSEVKYYCASTATEDISSASAIFNEYCNQGAGGASASAAPTTPASGNGNTVSQYVTDLQAYNDLAPCAGSALSYAVQHLTASDCPQGASGLQSCACTKNQNAIAASQTISSQVKFYCGSTHTADISAAQGVFAGYCGLPGTSAFPSPSYLPGAVSYYITDLPQYASLAPCARSAISYELGAVRRSICAPAPLALVSCACVQDNNSDGINTAITSQVKLYCSTTATADISSALGVFDYYCSAGKGLVTPSGVIAVASPTAGGKTPIAGQTGVNPTSGVTSSDSNSTSSSSKKGVPVGAIIGAAIGAVVFVFVVIFAIVRYRQSRRRHQAPPPGPPLAYNNQTTYIPPPAPVVQMPTPAPGPSPGPPVSPLSEKRHSPVGDQTSEMPTPPAPTRAELQPGMVTGPNRAEMGSPTGVHTQELPPNQQGQHGYAQELPPNQYAQQGLAPQPGNPYPNQYHEVPGGMSATSGPVYEMDGRHWNP